MSDAEASFADLIAQAKPNVAERLEAIRDATGVDERKRAIAETLLLWGAGAVSILERIPELSGEASFVLLEVLRGEIVTGRADELRRRAELSRQVIDLAQETPDVPILFQIVAAEALLQIAHQDGELVKTEERGRACTILRGAANEAEKSGHEDLELHIHSVLVMFGGLGEADRADALKRISILRTKSKSPTSHADAL